jgi:hypothetical protein
LPPSKKNTTGIFFPLDPRPPLRKINEIQKEKRFTQPRKQTSTSKNTMKKLIPLIIALSLAGIGGASANGTIFKTVNETDLNLGYMSVREGTNFNTIVTNAVWPASDLTAVWNTPTNVTYSPATATNPLWYNPPGGIGSSGNKTMQAYLYGQQTGTFAGLTLEFSGFVSDFSLATNIAGDPYTLRAYLRDAGPGGPVSQLLSDITGTGAFSISMPLNGTAGRTIQWGLIMQGPNIFPGDTEQLANAGSVTVVPEPSTYALLGLAVAGGLLVRRFRRKA